MKNIAIKKALKIIIGVVVLLALIVSLLFVFVSTFILPPEKLTPIVLNIANKNLNAEVSCDKIELTLFSTFPNLGVKFGNTAIHPYIKGEAADSATIVKDSTQLLSFREAIVTVQPLKYLTSNEVSIQQIMVDSLVLNALIDDQARNNWDIVRNNDDKSEESTPLPNIDIKSLQLKNGSIMFDSSPDTLYLALDSISLNMSGSLKDRFSDINIRFSNKGFYILSHTVDMQNEELMGIETTIQTDKSMKEFRLANSEIFINGLQMALEGVVVLQDSTTTDVDLSFGMVSPNLNEFLKILPKSLYEKVNFDAYGEAGISGSMKGTLGNGLFPVIKFSSNIDNGKLNINNVSAIDSIDFDISACIDMQQKDSSFLKLTKAYVRSRAGVINLSANIDRLLANQKIKGRFATEIDFGIISKDLKLDSVVMRGRVSSDVGMEFESSDIVRGNYGKIATSGALSIDSLLIENPFDSLMLRIDQIRLDLNTDKLIADEITKKKEKHLSGIGIIDSLIFTYKDLLKTQIRRATIEVGTTALKGKRDTNSITPAWIRIAATNFLHNQGDSAAMRAKMINAEFSLKPSLRNKAIPVLEGVLSIDTMITRTNNIGLYLERGTSTFTATHYSPDSVQMARVRAAREARIASGDTTGIKSKSLLGQGALEMLFRKWDAAWELDLKNVRCRTDYLPLPIRINRTKAEITNNTLALTNTELKVGASDFLLNGTIYNLRRTLLRGGKLQARLNIASDSINGNELAAGINEGINHISIIDTESTNKKMVEIDKADLDYFTNDSIPKVIVVPDTIKDGLPVIPEILDVVFEVNIKWLGYGKSSLENFDGILTLKDGNLHVSNLSMKLEEGRANVTLLYSPIPDNKAFTGFDLDLKDIPIENLIKLYPPIDTLVPMLRSFEGIIDCQMAATAELDSSMNIILPTLNAASYMHGKKMVLLDGETFAEISKKLMFKNKKRNVIDSIAVEVIVRNNQMEIFPFLIEMDRYRAAVTGVQNLDMSFNYHISVLKSPLPFKIGVDVRGNIGNFKYKITSPKLKNNQIISRRSIIDSSQVNVRRGIEEQLHKYEEEGSKGRTFMSVLPMSLDTLSKTLLNILDSVPPPPESIPNIDSLSIDSAAQTEITDTLVALSLLKDGLEDINREEEKVKTDTDSLQ